MRGDPLARWRLSRAVEADSNRATETERAKPRITATRIICRDLEAFQSAGIPLYPDWAERSNRWAFIEIFKSKVPSFLLRKAAESARKSISNLLIQKYPDWESRGLFRRRVEILESFTLRSESS